MDKLANSIDFNFTRISLVFDTRASSPDISDDRET